MADHQDVVVNVPKAHGVKPGNGMRHIASDADIGNGTPVVFKVRSAVRFEPVSLLIYAHALHNNTNG